MASVSEKWKNNMWFSKKSQKSEIRSHRHQAQRVARLGTRLTVPPLVLRNTGTRAKLKPPAQRLSVISSRRITDFDFFLIDTWTYVSTSILNIYERFKVIRLIKKVYSESEKSSHVPSWKNAEKSWDRITNQQNKEIRSNRHQTQRVGRVGTRLTVPPLVIRNTGTRAKLKPPAQRKSMISPWRITEFYCFW